MIKLEKVHMEVEPKLEHIEKALITVLADLGWKTSRSCSGHDSSISR